MESYIYIYIYIYDLELNLIYSLKFDLQSSVFALNNLFATKIKKNQIDTWHKIGLQLKCNLEFN